jgi:hypothetical protein
MLIVPRDLKLPLILSIALIASCLSTPESPEPEPEPELNTAAQASTAGASPEFAALAAAQLETDLAVRAVLIARAVARAKFAVRAAQDVAINVPPELDPDDNYTEGGHCNVRLTQCDPYPIGKGNHTAADAYCSRICLDTIAHCEDYSIAEIEFCCAHPDKDYKVNGKLIGHCMPSGEPNWYKRCAPGLNP